MVQVTFLGTGAAFSTSRRTNVSLLIREGDTQILVECGPGILHQLGRAGVVTDEIDYLFVSHRHGDHVLGMPLFLGERATEGTGRPLTILSGADVLQAARDLTHVVFPELARRLSSLAWREMPADRVASIDLGASIKLSTMPTPHSPEVPTLALRIDFLDRGRSLVYTGDTTYSERVAELAAGCDLLVHEANFCEALHPGVKAEQYGHSTARQAGRTAAQASCGILALVHLSPNAAGREAAVRAEAAQEFGGQIIVPSDGGTVFL